jgi:AraC-like DNA-binding protein
MSVVVDTALVPAQERFDAWAEANLEVFEPIAVRPRAQRPFDGRIVRHELGPLQLLVLSADASVARRTAALVRLADPECVQVMVLLRGACGIAQGDRSSLIRQGDLGTWHSSSPYIVESRSAFEMLIVTCPTMLLQRQADRIRRRTAQPIDGSAGVGRLVREHLTTLLELLDVHGCPPDSRAHLGESLFDLIRALHASEGPATRTPRHSSHQLRAQIDAYIDANLGDSRLGRAAVARAHHISRSYLDRLFEAGDGVSEVIRSKRLDRVRRDLDDPELGHQPVFAIGTRWGFVSPSHLSRAFRGAFGQSPTAYREAAMSRLGS